MQALNNKFAVRRPVNAGERSPMKRNIDATEGPLFKKLLLFALPIMATNILQMLYNIADQVVVGQCAGKNALSAVGCTGNLITLTLCFCTGMSLGSGVSLSHAFGSKNKKSMKHIVDSAMILSVVSGLFFGVFCFLMSPIFLGWMGTPSDILGDAVTYLRIYYLGMPVNFIYNFGASMLRSIGDSKKPLIFLIVSGLLNVLLNCILDIGFGLGVIGVAIGTIASQTLSAILVIITLLKGDGPLKLELKNLSPKWESVKKILRIGIPTGLQSAMFAISNVLMQSSVNLFGSSAIAGSTAASSVENIAYMGMHSLTEANLTFTGQNYGAKKPERIKKLLLISLLTVSVIGIVLGNGLYLLRDLLIPLFVNENDPAILSEILYAGGLRIAYIGIPYFTCGIMDVLDSTLRGIGKSVLPMIMTLIGSCIFRIIYIFAIFRPAFDALQASGGNVLSSMNILFMVWSLSWLITIALLIPCVIYAFRWLKKLFGGNV